MEIGEAGTALIWGCGLTSIGILILMRVRIFGNMLIILKGHPVVNSSCYCPAHHVCQWYGTLSQNSRKLHCRIVLIIKAWSQRWNKYG